MPIHRFEILTMLLVLSTGMSFRRPQVLKPNKSKSRSPSKPTDPDSIRQRSTNSTTNLVDIASLPPQRRPYGSHNLQIEPERLLWAPGGPYTQPADPARLHPSTYHDPTHHDLPNTIHVTLPTDPSIEKGQPQRQQREAYRKWIEDIIPSLVVPYLTLLQETNGLQQRHSSEATVMEPSCIHNHPSREINITCVYLDSEDRQFFDSHLNLTKKL
jgi:hypothetical protein